jgi:hypothetical protein
MAYLPNQRASEIGMRTTTVLGGNTINMGGNLLVGDTSVILDDSTSFGMSGAIRIGDEIIRFTGNAANTLTGLNRGIYGTTAKEHADGLQVGECYNSGVLDLEGFTQVQTHVLSDTDSTMIVNWYSDLAGTDQVRLLTVPYAAADGFRLFAAPAFTPYVRYLFANGSTSPQTDLFYETDFLHTALSPQTLGLDAFIAPNMVANLARTILVGKNDGGQFKNVRVDNQQHLEVNASNPKTAYDEMPMAELSPIAQLTYSYNVNEAMNLITENNNATITQSNNMAILQTTATANGQAILESRRKITFRVGQGALARFDCVFTKGAPAGSRQWVGVGDADDGFFFGFDGDGFAVQYRTNGSDTTINQVDWNIDKLDGAGPSGMTLLPNKGNVYQISYGAGFGNVNYSIESDTTGDMVLVHTIAYSNANTVPSTYNPTFPMCAEAHNGGATTNVTLSVNSMSSFIEGEDKVTGPLQAYAFTPINVTTTVPLFTLSNLTTFAGITNKVNALLKSISLVNDTNGAGTFKLIENGTLTGAGAYTPISAGTSVMAVDTAASAVTGGRLLWAGSVQKDGGDSIDISGLELLMYPGNFYTFTAETLGGSNPMAVDVVWQEDF